MKVIEDKVTVYPPHAICRADVPLILAALPPEWTEGIKTVRLSSAQQWPLHRARFMQIEGSLSICSRGQTREATVHAILMELAVHGLGFRYQRGRHLPEKDAEQIRKIIAPLVETIVPQLSRKKVWLAR